MTSIASLPVSMHDAPHKVASGAKNATKAHETAVEFEATFLSNMLESMFDGINTSAPFGGGHAEQQFRSVLLGEYAKDIAKSGGIGVADAVYREILAVQEGQV